jgi:hypothetical protein
MLSKTPGKGCWRAPDLVKRDFPARQVNRKWYGDGTEIRVRGGAGVCGHEDHGRGGRAMATYVRAGLPEVAAALATLTGEPHPLVARPLSLASPVLVRHGHEGHRIQPCKGLP